MSSDQIQKLNNILPYLMGGECYFEDTDGKSSTGVITLSLLSDFKNPALYQKGKKYITKIVPYVKSFTSLSSQEILDLISISTNFIEFSKEWKITKTVSDLGITTLFRATCYEAETTTVVEIDYLFDIRIIESSHNKESENTIKSISNQVQITLYLMAGYYDIFQLREMGLAKEIIDKTKEIQKIKQGI